MQKEIYKYYRLIMYHATNAPPPSPLLICM